MIPGYFFTEAGYAGVHNGMEGIMEHRENIKLALKWMIAIFIIAAIIYTFRGSAGPIWQQLCHTRWTVILTVCLLSAGYEMVEALITYLLATM